MERKASTVGTVVSGAPERKDRSAVGALAALLALLAIAAWTRRLGLMLPLVAGVASLTALLAFYAAGAAAARRRWMAAAAVLLSTAAAAGVVEARLAAIPSDWEEAVAQRRQALAGALDTWMERRTSALRAAAAEAREAATEVEGALLYDRLDAIRRSFDVSALAVMDSTGDLIAWSGDHRGRLAERIRAPVPPPGGVHFSERPLFSYLYALDPATGMSRSPRAVAAILLEGAVTAAELGLGGEAQRFADEHGARPRFAPGGAENASWTLRAQAMPVVHATFDEPVQAEALASVVRSGTRLVAVLILVALALMWSAWLARPLVRRAAVGIPVVSLLALLILLPLGTITGLESVFSPAHFLLPGPFDLTLGHVAVVVLPLLAWLTASRHRQVPALSRRRALAFAVAASTVAIPAALAIAERAASDPLYQRDELFWLVYQPVVTLGLTLLLLLLLMPARGRDGSPGASVRRDDSGTGSRGTGADGVERPLRTPVHGLRTGWLVTGLALAAALALLVEFALPIALAGWRSRVWLAAAWAVPFGMAAVGVAAYEGRASRLLRLFVAGWIAATAALPVLEANRVRHRLAAVERDVATLGTRADPFLSFLLRRFAQDIAQRDRAGESGVSLVYRSWAASGLANEAYSARITVWGPDGVAEVELTPGAADGGLPRMLAPPEYMQQAMRAATRIGAAVYASPDEPPNVQEVVAVPLEGGRIATVVVPVRRMLQRPAVLEPLLGRQGDSGARLTLVPAHQPEYPVTPGQITWFPVQEGWRGEALLQYPEGSYHAHVELRSPPGGVRFARGALLLCLDLLLLTLLWFVGRAAAGDAPRPHGGWRTGLGSYRARVTGALFAFFLIPTLLFGAVAYQALAGEVTRAARLVSERAVRRAVDSFDEEALGDLPTLASLVGADVLYYNRGELLGASTPEVLDLGLYRAWMPDWAYRALRSGEELEVVAQGRLGERDYLIAFRALPAAGVLAVPAWPASGEAATRQMELAHMVLFAALAGALLSFALSLAVGRALAGPIGRLRLAAAAVGTGNLRVRLPDRRADEFGQLYRSFNHMIQRLRQARAQEVRTARVLAWGEMARQVAHEIKNPLTPIKLAVQHVRRAYGDRRPDFERILESNVEQILAEIDRLSGIAQVFARYGAPLEAAGPLETTRLGPIVDDVLRLYASGKGPARFAAELPDDLPPVRTRPDELKEVLINLLENAREALLDGGSVVVGATTEAEYVVVEVRDEGVGIPAETMPHIFEPRFSSRTSGTGLGLAIVRRLVEGWGGAVEAESQPGGPTVLRFTIPRADVDFEGLPTSGLSGADS